jgi:hypothetical protein
MALRNKYENASLSNRFVEGHGVGNFSTYQPQGHFTRMVVLDVISDPNNVTTDAKVSYWRDVLGVTNIKYAYALPRNSIVAIEVGDEMQPMFVFPFFPSHLALPCKPGEVVWTMIENPDSQFVDLAYWMCKVVQPHYVDDVNHTHEARIADPSFFPGSIANSQNSQPVYELRNGTVQIKDGLRKTIATNAYLVGAGFDEDVFERLLFDTDAGRMSQWESVPRFRKRPGDIALEGSNNSLIVLGTDRSGPLADYQTLPSPDDAYAVVPLPPAGDLSGSAGSIEMVVGRGQANSLTGGVEVDTTSIVDAGSNKPGTTLKKEIGKSLQQTVAQEGDLDPRNDRSRVQISQRTLPDTNFSLSQYNQSFSIADTPEGDAAIVMKTDKMRIIARSDVEILVTNFTSLGDADNPEKPTIKDQEDDTSKWASIVIKSNGDIVFRPSATGYIKLGGDDADKGVVCSDSPVSAVDGNISGAPLITTMGGAFAGATVTGGPGEGNGPSLANGQAKFANKVLIK